MTTDLFATNEWTTVLDRRYKPLDNGACLLVDTNWGNDGPLWRWQHRGPGYDPAIGGSSLNASGYAATAEDAMRRADEYVHCTGESTKEHGDG